MRRGDISPVFKYIMVMIVGVLFLIFFVGFAANQMGLFGSLKDYESAYGFDDTLQALSVNEDSEITLAPKVSVVFQFFQDNIIVGESTKKTDKIIFSPEFVYGNEIYVATQNWYYPFSATNFFYLSDINHKYIFLYDQSSEDFAKDFTTSYDGFPSRFLSEVYDYNDLNLEQIKSANPDKILRFVFLFEPSSAEKKSIDNFFEGESVIWIDLVDEENGYVHYDDFDGIYLGLEMLTGAIVANDGESYFYQYELAKEKLISMSGIYLDKAALLQSRKQECSYSSIQSNLNSYVGYVETGDDPVLFATAADKIKDVNKGYGGNCPKLF